MKKQNNTAVFSLEPQHFWGNPMSTKEDYVQYLKTLKHSKYTKGKIIFNEKKKKDLVYLYKSETIHHPPTWSLVMVTHWRRSLLIRYSKESSSLISNWPELQGLVVPLAIGTCCSDKNKDKKKSPSLIIDHFWFAYSVVALFLLPLSICCIVFTFENDKETDFNIFSTSIKLSILSG